jgi:hypothetical protein
MITGVSSGLEQNQRASRHLSLFHTLSWWLYAPKHMQQGQIEADELTKALQDVNFSSSGSNDQELPRSCISHPQTSPAHAGRRSRGPSLSMRRRNSFDERRIPPTLSEDHKAHDTTIALESSAPGSALPATRSRSSSTADGSHTRRASHQLLRRISTDTALSLDFDSDVRASPLLTD